MIIEEFNTSDIGQHYLELQKLEVEDKDIGRFLRKFIEASAPIVASENSEIAYGVEGQGEQNE